MPLNSLLEGFEIVASDSVPCITLDNQRRFYLNTSVRRLTGVKPYERLSIAYNPTERRLAIIRPTATLNDKQAAELATSTYNIDKRYYMSARYFSNKYAFPPESAPYSFAYEQKAGDGSVFIFRLI